MKLQFHDMELSKYIAHRNLNYLNWLRKEMCAVSGEKAECTHHVRIGTNGGCSIKPSDYFCIPLLHEFHTTGKNALHLIGEKTFFEYYDLDFEQLVIFYLKKYLINNFDIYYMLENRTHQETISDLIIMIESNIQRNEKPTRKPKKKESKTAKLNVSITESNFYQTAKALKNSRDKELRKKIKEESKKKKSPKQSLKGNDFYERSKEVRKQKEKEYRLKNRESNLKYQKEQRQKIKERLKQI